MPRGVGNAAAPFDWTPRSYPQILRGSSAFLGLTPLAAQLLPAGAIQSHTTNSRDGSVPTHQLLSWGLHRLYRRINYDLNAGGAEWL